MALKWAIASRSKKWRRVELRRIFRRLLCFNLYLNQAFTLHTRTSFDPSALADPTDAVARLRGAEVADSLAALEPAELLSPWLQLTTSLTKHLSMTFGVRPGLIVLGEALEQGSAWERAALQTDEPLYARHIALTIDQQPVVLARSVTTQGAGMQALTNLQTRPLAELLFTDASWQRSGHTQYLCLPDGTSGRGVYWRNQTLPAGLLVEEFFLPSLLVKLGS